MKKRILSIICSGLLGGLAFGQAGSLDPGFNSGSGTNGEVQAAVQQADGKTLIIGTFTSYDGTTRNRVARLGPDGTLDPSFDPAAGPSGGYVLAALEQSDGRIVLAGEFISFNGVPRNGIVRLNADGSVDNSFDPGTGVAGSFPAGILAMALQPDGKIIVGGNFDEYNGTTLNNIARLNTDGSLDGSFDAVANDYVRAIELQPDGKVLIGGDFTDAGGFSFWHIARLNTDGSADLTFNPEGGFGTDYEVNDIERQPDGKILIVGYFSEYNSVPRMRIARLLPNGNLDPTFDPGISADDSVEDVSLQPDGKIFISGNFGNYQGVTRNRLARLLPDGNLDTTFDPSGSGANGWILQATALPGGKVLICGSFSTYDGTPAGGIARLRTTSVTDMAFDPGTGPNDAVLTSLPVGPLGDKMIIAGRFTDYDGRPANGIARINRDGSIDTTFHIGSGANGAVLAIDTLKCGSLLVAGEFTTFNDTVVNGLVQLNPDGSIDTTFQWTFDHEAYDLPDTTPVHVTSVTVPPPELLFIPEPPVVITITVPDPVAPPLEFSGTLELTAELNYAFTPLSGGSPGDVFTDTELTPDAGVLVVGNQPAPDGGTGTNLELVTWPPTTTFDPVQTTDANGNTSTIDNVTVNTGGFPWGDYVGAGNNLGPDTIPEWKILVAGDFINAGGVARNGIAQLNKDGSLDMSFDPGTGPNGPIRTMAVRPDGKILVGGEFTSFNGVTRSKIALLKPDGSVDESFDPGTGMDDDVNTISMFGEADGGGAGGTGCSYAPEYGSSPAVFAGGSFTTVDEEEEYHITVLDISLPADCAGVPGGIALPGSACDDGDAGTTNDVYGTNCICLGTALPHCNNDLNGCGQWPGNAITVDANGAITTIAIDLYASGEFSQVTGITATNDYQFTLSSGGYITVYQDGVAGTYLGSGYSPFTVTAITGGDLYAHWTDNELCEVACTGDWTTVATVQWMDAPPCTGDQVVVAIHTDEYADEISWEIRDESNAVVVSGTPTVYDGLDSRTVCLGTSTNHCYTFHLLDSYGDGIFDGGWELRTTDGGLLLRDDFADGSQSPSASPANPNYTAHSICLPAGPGNIAPTECGIFNNALGNKVYANKVAGASNYQFEFTDPDAGFIRRIARPYNYVHFWDMVSTPLVPGVKYFARVRTDRDGPMQQAHFGTGCEMGIGLPQVVACSELIQAPAYGHSCNETRAFNTNNSFIWAKPVVGATEYQFRIFNTEEGYDQTFIRSTYILQLKWNSTVAPALINGYTYQVEINVKVNGTYSGFCESSCTITIDNSGNLVSNPEASLVQVFGNAQLWPNPVRDGQVNLSLDGLAGVEQTILVDIQDIYGKQVFAKEYGNSGERFTTVLELGSEVASGVYLVGITVNGERTVQRLSVIR